MAVIDKKEYVLLGMKERLLSLSSANYTQALEDYKKLAYSIDQKMFESVAALIANSSDYSSYPYARQLELLSEIESAYNEYYVFQIRVINVCQQYGDRATGLSNIGKINISELRKRTQNIRTYLENSDILVANNRTLDKLNGILIAQNKQTEMFAARVDDLDQELRKAFLNAEGRCYSPSGELVYASSKSEAKKLGIEDLGALLDDSEQLRQMVSNAENEVHDLEENLNVTRICCKNSLNSEYRDICLEIENKLLRKKYELLFLQILSLVASNDNTYDGAKDKREKICSLIAQRVDILSRIKNVRYLKDPLSHIGIEKQLDIIKAYGENILKSKEVRTKIAVIANDNDTRSQQNSLLDSYLKTKVSLMYDSSYSSYNPKNQEESGIKPISRFGGTRKIINIRDAAPNFAISRAVQKANRVIKKVYELYNGSPVTTSMVTDDKLSASTVNPELVIVKSSKPVDTITIPESVQPMSEVVNVPEVAAVQSVDDSSVIQDFDGIFENDEFPTIQPAGDEPSENVNKDVIDSLDSDLFQNVNPFEGPFIYDGRVSGSDEPLYHDDNHLPNTNKPDVKIVDSGIWREQPTSAEEDDFWTVREDAAESKVKKLAA